MQRFVLSTTKKHRLKSFALFIMAFVIALTGTLPVSAAKDLQFYAGNEIPFSDPEVNCEPAVTPGSVPNELTVAQGNIKKKLSTIQHLVEDRPDFVTLSETMGRSMGDIIPKGYDGFRDGDGQARSTAVLWRTEEKDGVKWEKVETGQVIMVKDGPHPRGWDKNRASNWATLRSSDGSVVSVMSVHHMTNPNRDSNAKRKQTRKALYQTGMENLNNKIQELSAKGPVIIGGDFNHRITEEKDEWGAVENLKKVNVTSTFHDLKRLKGVSVDYIFYTDNLKATKQSMIPKGTAKTADHPFLFATLAQRNADSSDATTTTTGADTGNYKNPVIKDNRPDPSVAKAKNGTLHMYVSGLHHYSSKNGVKWKDNGRISIDGHTLPSSPGDIWAPDIAKVGDMYVLTWSQRVSSSTFAIHYATGDDAGGKFTYGGKFTLGGKGGIDPQIFSDGSDTFLYFARSNHIYASKLTVDGKKISDGAPKSVLERSYRTEPWTIEAPWVVERGGEYYLFYSTGKWDGGGGYDKNNYDLRVAKASSPNKKFTRKGKAILKSSDKFKGPGTAAVLSDSAGEDWLYYHARPGGGSNRTPMLDKVSFEGDWPSIKGGQPSNGGKAPAFTGGSIDDSDTSGACICQDPNASDSDIELSGEDNGQKIFNYLASTKIRTNGNKPMNDVQAAAFVGNFYQESKFDPAVVNSIGATGIAQWLGGRRTELANFAKRKGGSDLSLSIQLQFVVYELEGLERAIMSHSDFVGATDVAKATEAVRRVYERPGESEAHDELRIGAAKKALSKWGGGTPSTSGGGTSGSISCNSSTSGDIGVGKGDFTDNGEVKGWSTVLANAQKVHDEYKGSLEQNGWCAAISARTWKGENTGYDYDRAIDMWDAIGSSVGHADRKPKKGAFLIYRRNHVVIYLGNNKVLNDGFIRDANFIEGGGWGLTYVGWIDPNDAGYPAPKAIEKGSDTRTWYGFQARRI